MIKVILVKRPKNVIIMSFVDNGLLQIQLQVSLISVVNLYSLGVAVYN